MAQVRNPTVKKTVQISESNPATKVGQCLISPHLNVMIIEIS